jgi:hypothetical protein
MTVKIVATLAVLAMVGLAGLPATGQEAKPPEPKGMQVKGLVSSLGPLGGFGNVQTDLQLTGATVELQPGGQTGRQRFLVPTFIYVIEGVLTTEYDPGPIAHGGTQYFATGQSHVDSKSLWHNFKNTTTGPLKYLILHVGYPGAKTIARPEVE